MTVPSSMTICTLGTGLFNDGLVGDRVIIRRILDAVLIPVKKDLADDRHPDQIQGPGTILTACLGRIGDDQTAEELGRCRVLVSAHRHPAANDELVLQNQGGTGGHVPHIKNHRPLAAGLADRGPVEYNAVLYIFKTGRDLVIKINVVNGIDRRQVLDINRVHDNITDSDFTFIGGLGNAQQGAVAIQGLVNLRDLRSDGKYLAFGTGNHITARGDGGLD